MRNKTLLLLLKWIGGLKSAHNINFVASLCCDVMLRAKKYEMKKKNKFKETIDSQQ